MEGNPEDPAIHMQPGGWYSEAVMANALRVKHNMFRLDLDNPIQQTAASMNRLFEDNVQGVVVNLANLHWVAIRAIDGEVWLLDSQRRPVQFTRAQYHAFLRRHRNKFAVMHIA